MIRNGLSYAGYINSSSWERRRATYFSSHPRRCSACGSTDSIHLHHKTYDRMGEELDDDLLALCEFCHHTLHRWHDAVGGSLYELSEQFVHHFRQQPPQTPSNQKKEDFVPKHLRGAGRDSQGRLISNSDWRDEVRGLKSYRP